MFVILQKAKPAIWDGDRNPPGLELLSAGAERGNYSEAKPKRKGRKADLRAMTRASRVEICNAECRFAANRNQIFAAHEREKWSV